MRNGEIIFFPNGSDNVINKDKVIKMLFEIDYDKVFEIVWQETYCKYLNPETFATINLRTGKLECHDMFSLDHTSPYLIFRDFSIPSIDVEKLLDHTLLTEYSTYNESLEEFLKHKNVDDKKLFKNYYVSRWKEFSWYWDSIAIDELEKFYNNRDFQEELV